MAILGLRTPDNQFGGLPGWLYEPHYTDDLPGYGNLGMHYVDEGPKDGDPILCLHGQPTWSYMYREMIPVFTGAGHRVVGVDLFGFGRSDKPVKGEVYTYPFHRGALLAFVERLNLKDVCLVCLDWGGILGLTLPMSAPQRYPRLLVMNTGLPAGDEAPEAFSTWRSFNRSQHDLDIAAAVKRVTPIVSGEEAAACAAPFPDATYKGGVRRFTELVILRDKGAAELSELAQAGVETSLAARAFWSQTWSGASFMAIGARDPSWGPPAMKILRGWVRGCPPPADADHLVPEWGEPVARAALAEFGL